MEKEEMKLALQNVRKAYRLLADYQQRVLELLAFIKKELNAEYYYYALSNYRSPQSFHKLHLIDDNMGWKFLPMMNLNLLWHRTREPKDDWQFNIQSGDLVFDICVASDEDNDETLSVEESKSELHLYIYKCVKYTRKYNWYNDVWNKSEYPNFGEVGIFDKDGNKYQIYGEKIDLAELTDEQSVRKQLDEFRKRASEKLEQEI